MKTKVSNFLLALLLLPTLALAQAPSTSVIPYSGTLFSQGKPVSQSAPVQMAFALYTDTTGLDAGQTDAAPAANRVWSSWGVGDVVGSDLTIPVQVRNGRFLVHLGEDGQTVLADSVFDQRPLSVVAWVVQGSGAVYRLPAQALKKVPHAVTAERANSFEVMGDLNVEQNATVQGELTAQLGVKSNDAVYIDGNKVIDDNAGWHRSYGNTGWYNNTHGGGWYMYDSTWIRSYGNKGVHIKQGSLVVDGTLTLNSTRQESGELIVENGIWGSWKGLVKCPDRQYVCGLRARMEGNQGSADDTAFNGLKMLCCTLGK